MTPEIIKTLSFISLVLTVLIIYLLFRKPRTEKTVLTIVITTLVLALLDGITNHPILAFMWLGCSALWYAGYTKMKQKREEAEENDG